MRGVTIRTFYDARAAEYDTAYSNAEYRLEDQTVRRLIGEQLPDPVLDVGCGTGLTLELADIPPDQYLGIDLSEGMLQVARTKYPGFKFRQGDGADAVRSGRRFGTILALYGVLSYMPDLSRFLTDAVAALNPGGLLFGMAYGPTPETRPYIRCDAAARSYPVEALLAACPASSRIDSVEAGMLFGGVATYIRILTKADTS